MVSVGEAGKIKFAPPARSLLAAMECSNLEDAKHAILKLPNVRIEEGKNDNGGFTVIMQNWFKYQIDSTAYERLKRSRYKRRGEETREEEKRNNPPTPRKVFSKPTPEEVKAYALSIGYKLDGHNFCDHYESKGWMIGKNHMINWQAAVRTWKKGAPFSAIIMPVKPKEPDPRPEDLPTPEEIEENKRGYQGLVHGLGHKFP